jgi:uncharacterized membrane protein
MTYAILKAVHLLSLVAWVGGMFFTLFCLRPALAVLDAPARPRLMHAALRRFFVVVHVAIVLLLVSGVWMLWSAVRTTTAPGLAFNMPLDWRAMITLGLAMIGIFGHIRFVLFKRLERALREADAPAVGASLGAIRAWVGVNLVLGVVIVIVMRVGAAG